MDFGKRLRDEREHQGFTLDDVEQETKIRKLYIKAIEDEQFSVLPPKVYAIGFVKRYAVFLKLNENEIVEQFKQLTVENENETVGQIETEYSPSVLSTDKVKVSRYNIKNLVAAIAFLIIAVWLGNYLVGYIADQSKSADNKKTEVVQPDTRQTPKPSITDKVKVEITANQKCWVLVKVDDVNTFEGTMQPSEQKIFEGQEKIYINAGNAGGLSVKLNNRQIESFGKFGEVVKYELSKDGTIRKL